jgi:hypothetical protein
MTNRDEEMRQRIAAAIEDAQDQRALLSALEALAADSAFKSAADLWAPAVYARNPYFFEPFLLRYLDACQHRAIIDDLMQRAERDGYDALFISLYRKVADQTVWLSDMASLAASPVSDDAVLQAIQRHDLPDQRFTLSDDVAVTLYRRNPAVFGPFVLAHVRSGHDWQTGKESDYPRLRAAANAQGDDPVIWALFRKFASAQEWKDEIARLLKDPEPPASISDALEKRQPQRQYDIDPSPLLPVMDRFGAATIPYLERHLSWLAHIDREKFLAAVEKLGNQSFFRSVFFQWGTPAMWRDRVKALVGANLSTDELARRLAAWQPPAGTPRRRGWWLGSDLALSLYRRDPARFGAWVARTAHDPSPALFDAVAEQHDEDTLDALTFAYLEQLATIAATVYTLNNTLTMSALSKKQRDAILPVGERIIARLDRLASESPTTYAVRAARIVGQGIGAAWRMRGDDPAVNPVAYLSQRHRDAWRRSSEAMRELLESPDHKAIEFALDLLAADDASAARRVVENLTMLQALLLMTGTRALKRRVLLGLERAAAQDVAAARAIAPVLGEVMWYRGENALNERAMVSFVRARRSATPEAARVEG